MRAVGRWRVVAGVVAAAVVVGASVVGCSSSGEAGPVSSSGEAGPVSSSVVITGAAGTATVSNPASYLSLLDPCTLPYSVRAALKLGTGRRVQMEPFQFCNMSYVGDHLGDLAYGINVGSTTQSFEQMKKDQSY